MSGPFSLSGTERKNAINSSRSFGAQIAAVLATPGHRLSTELSAAQPVRYAFWADARRDRQLRHREAGRQRADIGGAHIFDALDQLGGRQLPAEHQRVARDLAGARLRTFKAHQQRGLELRLGALQFGLVRPVVGHRAQLRHDDMHQLFHLTVAGRGMHTEKAAV